MQAREACDMCVNVRKKQHNVLQDPKEQNTQAVTCPSNRKSIVEKNEASGMPKFAP
jgi:hypothetical protein